MPFTSGVTNEEFKYKIMQQFEKQEIDEEDLDKYIASLSNNNYIDVYMMQ